MIEMEEADVIRLEPVAQTVCDCDRGLEPVAQAACDCDCWPCPPDCDCC